MVPLLVLLAASLSPASVSLHILPEFTPNAVMLDKHADKGSEPWEIYAWCVRDLISAQSGLGKFDRNSLREKQAYARFMQGQSAEIEVDGQVYRFDDSAKNAYAKMKN